MSKIVENYKNYLEMLSRKDGDKEPVQWITTKNGHKVPLDENGVAIAGGGGTLVGKKFVKTEKNQTGAPTKKPTKEEAEKFKPDISNIKKPKAGYEYDDTVAEAMRTAYKDGNLDEWNEIVQQIDDGDIFYQQSSDGKKVASIIGLASFVDDKTVDGNGNQYGEDVQNYYDSVKQDGIRAGYAMAEIARSLGTRLSGLENCVKGASHVVGKMQSVKNKIAERNGLLDENGNPDPSMVSDIECLDSFSDLIRFTQMSSHAGLADETKRTLDELKKRGYTVLKIENKFIDAETGRVKTNADYKAIHIDLRTPGGNRVEYQIHSDKTLKAKELNHKLYDEMKKTSDPEEKKRLKQQMVENVNKYVDNPEGIETLKNFP